jgi:hypothetical protein
LAVVTFDSGEPTNTATTTLGDRVQVNSAAITTEGMIEVDMVQSGPDDPLCCPTQHVVNTYAVQNGELVEVFGAKVGFL